MTTDPAVTAAAEAMAEYAIREGPLYLHEREVFAALAVAAARPVIEAEVRARIAAEIEAADVPGRSTDWSLDEGLTIAARIAKGDTA